MLKTDDTFIQVYLHCLCLICRHRYYFSGGFVGIDGENSVKFSGLALFCDSEHTGETQHTMEFLYGGRDLKKLV